MRNKPDTTQQFNDDKSVFYLINDEKSVFYSTKSNGEISKACNYIPTASDPEHELIVNSTSESVEECLSSQITPMSRVQRGQVE